MPSVTTAAADTTPDAFSFTAQTGVQLNSADHVECHYR